MEIIQHIPWVKKIAKKVKRKHAYSVELRDLESAGYVGLCQAAIRFSPEQGLFIPYAYQRVYGSILDFVRVELSSQCFTGEVAIPTTGEITTEADLQKSRDLLLKHPLLGDYFFYEMTLQEIGERDNLNRSSVKRFRLDPLLRSLRGEFT